MEAAEGTGDGRLLRFAGGDEPPREAVDVEQRTEDAHVDLCCGGHALALHARGRTRGKPMLPRPCSHAFNPLYFPPFLFAEYVASPRSSPRAAAPWWGRSAVSVCPRVRVSACPRVRPSLVPRPLSVRTVRPVLLLKTTYEKKEKKSNRKNIEINR